jgi:hypothetical protein
VAVAALLLVACSAPAGAGTTIPASSSVQTPTPTPALTATPTLAPSASGSPASAPGATAQPAASPRVTPTSVPTPTRRPTPTPAPTASGSNGSPVAIPSTGGPWLVGVATAGPVCPVQRNPPDPACAPRPVVGATIAVLDPGGREITSATTGVDGTYRVAVPAGSVRVQAAPVAGLMGTPALTDVVVPAGPAAWVRVDLLYDTGIR